MKLKYKKIVIMIATFTMLIGLVVFSVISPSGDSAKGKQAEDAVADAEAVNVSGEEEESKEEEGQQSQEAAEQSLEQNPEQEIHLEVCGDAAINQLIIDYFDASVACDLEKLQSLVSDITILDENELKIKYELVDSIKNIECYLVKGQEEGKYLVYVYSEVKFKDIETLAPGLSRLSITAAEDGKYVIFFGADAEIEQLIEKADETKAVQDLVEKVSRKLEEALSSDAELKELNEKMTGSGSADSSQDNQEQGDSSPQE